MYEVKNPSSSGYMAKKYAAFNLSQNQVNKMAYVTVEQYAICNDDIELLTNGLSACSGLSISANGKVFMGHIPANHQSSVLQMKKDIIREFNIVNFNNSADVKVKIDLHSTACKSNSLNTILELLFELKLLDRVIRQLQNYIRDNTALLAALTQLPNVNLQEFLALSSVEKKADIENVADFIESIKCYFENSKDCVLSKGTVLSYEDTQKKVYENESYNDFVSSNNTVSLPPVSFDLSQQKQTSLADRHSTIEDISIDELMDESEDIKAEAEIVIADLLLTILRFANSRSNTFFSSASDYQNKVKKLYTSINETLQMPATEAQKIEAIRRQLIPFINTEAKDGEILASALKEIDQKLVDSVLDLDKYERRII